jgi:hypothetical protein
MNDFLIAGLSFIFGFALGGAASILIVGRWVWREFQTQRDKTAGGEGFPKPPPFVKN